MNADNDEAIEVLLKKHDENLSEWEITFLEDIYEAETLTPKQQSKLDEIWKRVMETT